MIRRFAILAAISLASAPAFADEATIAVSDQAIESGNIVKVRQVTTPVDGFVVIHAAKKPEAKEPGSPIGYAFVNSGSVSNISIKLEQGVEPGQRLTAVLHADTKKNQMFDEDNDKPLGQPGSSNGNVVQASFTAK